MKIETKTNKDGSITKTIDGKFWCWIHPAHIEELERQNEEYHRNIIWCKK